MLSKKTVFPGEKISNNKNEEFTYGKGTFLRENAICSAYFGYPVITDQLITAKPKFSHRYVPEVGDVVIGRVSQIYNKKWKLEMNSEMETLLGLGSIILPGVAQRRKSEADQVEMRNIFKLNDLIVCEVQKINKSGSASLHTRSEKYGKLKDGILIKILPNNFTEMNSRFVRDKQLLIICGVNGFIWISTTENYAAIPVIKKKIEESVENNQKIDIYRILDEI
ncbi:hypothetical protein NUSPORA_01088 [Nucleospora cyclopteri]